jgi:hypothetical protein
MMRVNLIDRSNPAFFTTVIANAWEGPQSIASCPQRIPKNDRHQ